MAEEDRTPDEAPAPTKQRIEIPIERDARFVRYAADDIFVVNRTDDILLSVIEQGPQPVSVRPPPASEISNGETVGRGQLGLSMSYTEVARIVIGPDAALPMALQVINRVLAIGAADPEGLRSYIGAIIDRHSGAASEEAEAE